MYSRILVPLENSPYDDAIIDHVKELARLCGASVLLMHVADGWAARNIRQLDLRESEEMKKDRTYLEGVASNLESDGVDAEALLASGDPASEILQAATREGCDLIAMSTHGHKFVNDLLRGSVASSVRHDSSLPVLLVRGNSRGRSDRAV
ncbi:MAG: universal stress protein [Gemmatimonadota bacterium]|nr:universal stress protein [Gemmatimonadota bacterium]